MLPHALLLAVLLAVAVNAQPGGVDSHAKVSASSGGFSGPLDAADFFGTSVARIGDLDGDAVPDLAAGAEEDDDGAINAGAVWILFMNVNGTVKNRTKLGLGNGFAAGEISAGDDFGCSVAGIGDLDGDNIPDLAVGARSGDAGALSSGAVWIVFLNANGTVKGKQVLNATTGGFAAGDVNLLDEFGRSIAFMGSLGGQPTIAVGASGTDGRKGGVWILGLYANGTIATKTKLTTASVGNSLDADDGFGTSVAGLGDINANGVPDIAVGAMLDDDGGSGRGAVWILLLQANGSVAGYQKISVTQGGFVGPLAGFDQFGRSLAAVGDLDCDGSIDLAVGAYESDDGGPDRGAVWIVELSNTGTVLSQQKISSTAGTFAGPLDNNDQFATSIAALGDFDGDLVPDIAVGAPNDDDGSNNAGAVWLLFLKSTDAMPPVITCPAVGITVPAEANLCTAVVNFTVTATDNCPGVTVSCAPPSGSVFSKGATQVNCIATDIANNNAPCGFTVTVLDTQPPTIACPAPVSANTAPNTCAAAVNYQAPAARDNCAGLGAPVCAPPSGSSFPKGVSTVSCTVADASGNTASCAFSVTVNDAQPPSIVCPANVVTSTAPNTCAATVSYAAPTVSDNCPGVAAPVCAPASGSSFSKGVTTVTCMVADASGNTAACSFTVTVNDTQPPSIVCPANITVPTAPNLCTAVVSFGAPAVSDNCPGIGAPICTPASGSVFQKGTTTVSCSVADASGNSAGCSFTVTVNDTQPPAISCPANIVRSNDPGQCSAIVTYPAPAVTDNCPGVLSPVCAPASGSVFPGGVTTVNCSVLDASGNSATCGFTITVNDIELPQITAPGPLSLFTDFGVCGKYESSFNLGTPVVTDNCPGVTYSNNAPNLFPVGTTTVTWTATDASGNTRTATQSVTITDNQAPYVNAYLSPTTLVPANQTMRSITAYMTVTDNCPGATFILYSVTSSNPDAGTFSGDLPNDIQGAGLNTPDTQFLLRAERGWSSRTYTVKYRGTDAHNNSAFNTRLVVVPVYAASGGYVTKDPDAETQSPKDVTLDQNYPNPFNPATVIRYGIRTDGPVRLSVYDMLSRRVQVLVDAPQTSGSYTAVFDGSSLPSGLYSYVLEANGIVLKKTMSLVK